MSPARKITRRAFGNRLIGATTAIATGIGGAASAVANPVAELSPELRDAALRGLALAGYRGDPVTAAAAQSALEKLAQTDPESAVLARIYQLLDVRPSAYRPEIISEASETDLIQLHKAISNCQPVAFDYIDLDGFATSRSVLPLALVHPPQGVKLVAWCEIRQDFRQFFVRSMEALTLKTGCFSKDRLALLEGFLEKQTGRG